MNWLVLYLYKSKSKKIWFHNVVNSSVSVGLPASKQSPVFDSQKNHILGSVGSIKLKILLLLLNI